MNHRLFLVVNLIVVVTFAEAWCGTKNSRPSHTHGREQATCIITECDTDAVRSLYEFKEGTSPIYRITVNSILFGDYFNDAELNKNFNDSMDSFKSTFRQQLGIDLTIRPTFVSDEYQAVADSDDATHRAMATKYFREGELTVMFTRFTEESLLGYAVLPWSIESEADIPGFFTIMTNTPAVLSGNANTTIYHEVGHMLGLLHVFNERDDCSDCIELPSSPDRNVVGDFCNDTLPMGVERSCDGNLLFPTNCKGESFGTAAELPVDNFMAYTLDSCQTLGFTPQQVARARCYLATSLTFLNPGPPIAPPTAPTAAPTAAPTGRVSEGTSVASTVAVLISAVVAITF